MANYTKLTDFAAKDDLVSGNPSKVVKGTEIDTEFDAIQTAVATKADSTDIAAMLETSDIGVLVQAYVPNITTTEIGYLDNVTSNIQTQLNAKLETTSLGYLLQTTDIGVLVQAYDIDIATVTASQAEMEAGTESALRSMSPLRVSQAIAALSSQLTVATTQATTSGTSIDFTSIPSWVKRITVMFNEVSTSGTSPVQVQLGTSGGLQTSGYNGTIQYSGAAVANLTTGFKTEDAGGASYVRSGIITVCLLGSNIWAGSINSGLSNQATAFFGGGAVSLSGTLDRIRLTTVNGTDTFDAGSVNILYEG